MASDPTASIPPASDPSGDPLIGATLGERYRVLGVIGEGAFGVVYEADQTDGVRRRVAVKVIKPGMDSRAVVGRFRAEQQALAVMDHPGIARVLDAGQTDRDLPYFVMELVKGEPITEFCDKNRLTIDQRLTLMTEVSAAVQHAHAKGVIHRDLKPTNVLVAYDNEGHARPKVIDFGVAKALNQPLTEQTIFTERGQLIGTPEYMSPEQVEAAGTDVDTRADVYSLGVMLYELLTGTRPFDLRRTAFDEIRRLIRETDPERPSTRLESVLTKRGDPETASKIVRARRAEPRSLTGVLRRDLDWVVMKSLEKDRERRYETASAFANDVRRYLNGDAVEAGPPRASYLVGKFIRRHRAAVAFASVLLLVIITAVGAIGAAIATASGALRREKAAQQVAQAWSDLRLLQEAVSEAERLWPPYPGRIDDLELWIEEYAQPLLARVDQHESLVQSIREHGDRDPNSSDPRNNRSRQRELETVRTRLATIRDELQRFNRNTATSNNNQMKSESETLSAAIADLERREQELQEMDSVQQAWRFEDPVQEWRFSTFSNLVHQLRAFQDPATGLVASVEKRIRIAERIRHQTITGQDARERWAEAIADISNLEAYGGLQIEPQMGLLPLRRDPDSGLWEFWHVLSGQPPVPATDPEASSNWRIEKETGIVLVLVPAGDFWMGAQSEDPSRPNYGQYVTPVDRPPHRVSTPSFFVSKYEMTQAQWYRLTGETPSYYGPEWQNPWQTNSWTNPVEGVSWADCQEFLHHWDLQLPSEQEWEYAARAGTSTPWWSGPEQQDIGRLRAGNIADDWGAQRVPTAWKWVDWHDGWAAHAPVGTFTPNGFGLHDTIGNVWEWCAGYFEPYPGASHLDDAGFLSSDPQRVCRGGSYYDPPEDATSYTRYPLSFGYGWSENGLRPIRPLR